MRRAVGPEIGLSIDFHHRLSVAEAALFCQKVADVHLMFLEEPIRAQSPKAYPQLRAMTPVPFAIGEEFSNKWEFQPYVEEGILNYARIDVSNVGGLSEARKVAGWCESHYIDVMPHNPLGPICTAASIHFCAALNNEESVVKSMPYLKVWHLVPSAAPKPRESRRSGATPCCRASRAVDRVVARRWRPSTPCTTTAISSPAGYHPRRRRADRDPAVARAPRASRPDGLYRRRTQPLQA